MDNKVLLKELAFQGCMSRYGEVTEQLSERLEYEIGVINKMNFTDYFLVLRKVFQECKNEERVSALADKYGLQHPIGNKIKLSNRGRGSGVGSLVCYCLGITGIDPIKYGLQFERFLNPERFNPPDIDTDVASSDRPLLIKLLQDMFPYVCQIGTVGTLNCKGVIKEVAKALDVPFAVVNKFCKLIPDGYTVKDVKEDERLMDTFYTMPFEDHQFAINCMERMEGLTKSSGRHAGGVVMSDVPIEDYIPLWYDSNGENPTTQYDMHFVEDMGFIKYDFLGLANLSVLAGCEEATGISTDEFKFDDKEVLMQFKVGDTDNVFQFDSQLAKQIETGISVDSFEDIVLSTTLCRPSGTDNVFEGKNVIQHAIDRKAGREPIVYLFPEEEQYLATTYGLMVYQEQIMKRVQQLTGCSLGKADLFRRAVGKKDEELLKQQVDWLKETAMSHRFTESEFWDDATWRYRVVDAIAEEILANARYGFNSSHATAYGGLAYDTAYFKRYYPEIFYCSLLRTYTGDIDKQSAVLETLKNKGWTVSCPNINSSELDFTVIGDKHIAFGFSQIKGLGKSASAIIEERKHGNFSSVEEFVLRLPLSAVDKTAFENLCKAGAFDEIYPYNRETLLATTTAICDMRKKRWQKRKRKSGDYIPTKEDNLFLLETNDKKIQYDTSKRPDNIINRALFEEEVLGRCVTCSPIDDLKEEIVRYGAIHKPIQDEDIPNEAYYCGFITSHRVITIQKQGKNFGKQMCFVSMNGLDFTLFPDLYNSEGMYVVDGDPVVIRGKRNEYNGKVSIVASYVRPMVKSGVRSVKEIHLTLNNPDDVFSVMRLHKLCSESVGNTELYIHIKDQKEIVVKTNETVCLNDFLIEELEKIGTLKYGELNL